jgi:hypothetical protein
VRFIVLGDIGDLCGLIPTVESGGVNSIEELDILIDSLQLSQQDTCVFLASGVTLCNNFCIEVERIISQNSGSVIQFYSEGKDDLRLGTRLVSNGRGWLNVCFYLPSFVKDSLVEYLAVNRTVIRESDSVVQWVSKFLSKSKIVYLNICPNLVDLYASATFIKERKTIKVTCDTESVLPLYKVVSFQRGIKTRSQKQVDHLVTSILQNGFSYPIFIWKHNDENHCLDGHGRILALLLLERRGFVIPNIPVVYIEAGSEKEAKLKLIEINNVNGLFSKSELLDFIKGIDIDYSVLKLYDIDFSDITGVFDVSYESTFSEEKETGRVEKERGIKKEKEVDKIDVICPKCNRAFSVKK